MLDNQSPEASTANTSKVNENQFYFAIRSSNLKLIKTLVAQCKSSSKLDESLSQAYDELRLKNVPISDEIRIFVESTLIDLRFFSNTSTKQAQINKNSIRERIQLVLENINLLKTEYSNIKAVDEKFLFIAKFVVQNIHILKRQLKSTYDRLPWEEIEFCLVSFISSYMKRQEINLFYQASLNKFKILNYLETFGARLEEEIEGVNIDKLSDLPKLKREEVISEIISSSPEFEELYSDYQQIRDIHSLKKISNYINLALSADPKQKEGQLVITRTLQVIGECLKNTLESPKLSSTTSGLLLLSLPQNTRKILIDLRNSLSHAYSLSKRMDIEENADINFFVSIQNNIRKIGDVVTGILFNSKMKTVRMLLKKIINSKNLDEIKEVAAVLDNVKLEIGSLVSSKMTEDEKLEKLVKELSDIITDKTNDDQELFDKINNIISSIKAKSKNIKTDYVMGFALLESLSSQFNDNKVDKNVIRGIKFRANKTLENISPKIESESLKEIAMLSTRVSHTVRSRMTGKGLDEVNRLIYEIFCIAEFGVDDNKSIRKLREKLKGNTTFEDKKSKDYDISEKKHNKQLELKLFQLKKILNNNQLVDNFTEKFSSYDSDKKLQAVVEMLVLDIMSILERENRLVNNLLFLDDNTPLLTGKYLRDHLAHDNLLVTTLLPDPSIAVFLNARKLTVEGMLQNKKKIGKLLKNDPDKVKEKYNQDFTTIDNQQKMFIALEEGDLETFKYCLEKGADIGARDINLWTTLHFAIKGSNLETIKYILDHSVNASAKDIDGQSPLHIAAAYGRKDVIEFFIKEFGLYVDELNNHGKTPLHIAAQNGHKDAVEVLLENNSNTVIQDMTGCEPLHYAIRNNYVDVTKVLLKNVDINEIRNGCTPLHIAAEFGYLELLDFLLQNGADVNYRNNGGATPLHLSALNGHFEVVNTLIERGANVNARVIDGCTPLHYAVENGHQKVIYILLKHNANVNVADRVYSNTPLHYASKDGYKQIVEILLDNGANTNVTTVEGITPLHFAAQGGHLEIISILLKHNVDVNAQDKNGSTPLHYAAGFGREKAAALLVKHKANVNAQDNKDITPLHVAASIGQNDVIKVLIKNNAKVDAQDVEGNTPLHEAAANGSIDTLELLVQNKAQVNYRNNHGITPIHLATLSGKKNAVDFLMRNKTQVSSKEIEYSLYIAVEKNDKELVKSLIASGANVNAKNNSLISAIKHNYKEIVGILIASGANVNEKGGEPLLLAVFGGYTDIVKILIKNKARINFKYTENTTLLHLAATRGHKDIVEILINEGADIDDSMNVRNVTPLHGAVQGGHKKVVKILLRNGANVNFNSKDGAPIHMAAGMGHNDVVRILINEGAEVNIKDRKNRTALELAVARGHLQVVKTFFEYKEREIDIHDKGNDEFTLLHIASQESNTEIVKYLVEKGCDINAKNASGSKPIHIAARESHLDTVKFFLSNGLDINEPGMKSQTLLHYAAINGQLEIIKYLIVQGADVNAKDANGATPLHIAANLGHKDVIKVLLKNGAVYNAVDKFNRKPLLLAANNKDVINLLASTEKLYEAVKRNSPSEVENYIKAGACVNAKNVEGVTPLYYGSWKGYGNIVDILLQNKASPNVVDKKGLTPLHYAAKFSHLKIVESLLFHGAIYNAVSDSGKTPLDFTTDENITALLSLIDKSFRNVENGNTRVIGELGKISEMSMIKAIMNARNRENKTLIVAAIHNNFSKVEQLKQIFQSDVSTKVNIALMLLEKGNYKKALDIFQKVFESRRQILGEDNPGTLEIQRHMALTLYKQGKYQEALNILNSIVEKQTKMLGIDNKDTLKTRSMVALILHRQERNDEALGIYQEVYSKQREVLGPNHLDTLNTQFHMALVLERQGQYEEALRINKMVFEHRKIMLGEYDPATIHAQNNIALVLLSQEKYEESLKIYNEVLKKKKSILGNEHPDTLRTLQSIAGILLRQKKYNESLSTHKEVLDIQKRILGPSHPETLNTQFNMGDVFLTQGKFIHAFRVYKESFELGKAILGIGHPQVLQASQKMEFIKLRFKFTGSEGEELRLIQSIQEELNLAASNGDIKAIRNLLDSGANINDKDTDGRTTLCYAVNNGHTGTIDILLKNGADPTLITNKGNTPLHMASNKGNRQVIGILLDHVKNNYPDKLGKFINAQTILGGTSALHIASNIEVTRSLLQYGAVYNIKNKEGKTPLDLAKNDDIRKLLSFTNELFEGVKNGNRQAISKLRSLEADDFIAVTNARNDQGHTLLQVAIASKHRNIASQLLEVLKKPDQNLQSINLEGKFGSLIL